MTDEDQPPTVADMLAAFFEAPTIIADPWQLHDGRVWAHASDIVEGAWVTPGETLVAAWEQVTWTAKAEWDEQTLDWLWLSPVAVLDAPRASEFHADTPMVDVLKDFDRTVALVVRLMAGHRAVARSILGSMPPDAWRSLDESVRMALLQSARWPRPLRPPPPPGWP